MEDQGKSKFSLTNNTIQDLITIQIVEEAKQRIINWIQREGKVITICISFIIIVLSILSFFGIKSLYDVKSRAKEASEIVEKTLPKVSNFADTVDSLNIKLYEIASQTESSNYEIDRLEGQILFLREELMQSAEALRDLLAVQAETSNQLKKTLTKYEHEIIDLEQRKTKFQENQSINILIQYGSDTKKRAQKCKEILIRNGFQVKLSELSKLRSAYFKDRNFSEKVRYFNEELSHKAEEVSILLKTYGVFQVEEEKLSEKGEFSFLIWILI